MGMSFANQAEVFKFQGDRFITGRAAAFTSHKHPRLQRDRTDVRARPTKQPDRFTVSQAVTVAADEPIARESAHAASRRHQQSALPRPQTALPVE